MGGRHAGELIWAGLLSFVFAETFAGSSAVWITNPFVYAVTIPLYVAHFLLLAQIALSTRRTSLPALYLLGVVFGLYETFITKVVWHGYPGAPGFALGGMGPFFGVHETLGLVLFYHPVVSFLLPLGVATRLLPSFSGRFEQAEWLFARTGWGRLRRGGLIFVFAMMSGSNLGNPWVYLGTWLPGLVIVVGGYWLLRVRFAPPDDKPADRDVPFLSQWGLTLVLLVLVLLYGWSYDHLLPQFLPPMAAQAAVLGAYAVLALLIWRTPAQTAPANGFSAPGMDLRLLADGLFISFIVGLAVSGFAGQHNGPVMVPVLAAFLSMIPAGLGLFAYFGLWRALLGGSARQSGAHSI